MIVSLSVQVVAPVKVWKLENNLKLRLEGKNGKEFIRQIEYFRPGNDHTLNESHAVSQPAKIIDFWYAISNPK